MSRFSRKSELDTVQGQVTANASAIANEVTARQGAIAQEQSDRNSAIGAAVNQLVDSAPTNLNTIGKIAAQLNSLINIVQGTTPDANNLVNTIQELLAVFANYPEGASVADALAGKINTSDLYNALDQLIAGKALDARQGKVLSDAIGTANAAIAQRLTGSAASDTETQITGAVTEDNKFVSRLKLFNWWVWIKQQAATIAGNWNFTGTLKQNGNSVLTTADIDMSTKLNTGNNTGLAGDEGRVTLATVLGQLYNSVYLKFLTATRELQIGLSTAAGKLTVFSNIFKLYVQDNIGDGQAFIVLNSLQDKALQIVDKLGNVYMIFRTLANGAGVVISRLWIFDMSVASPVYRAQAAVSTTGTSSGGVKVYATKGDVNNTQYAIDMTTDTQVMYLNARLKIQDSTGSKVIHARFETTIKRIGGLISVVGSPPSPVTICDTSGASTFSLGWEAKSDNSGVLLYFTPAASDNTAYTGSFLDITYSI